MGLVLGFSKRSGAGACDKLHDAAWVSGDLTVGDWGVNTVNHTVWAVLNHDSEFAVVPEPDPRRRHSLPHSAWPVACGNAVAYATSFDPRIHFWCINQRIKPDLRFN